MKRKPSKAYRLTAAQASLAAEACTYFAESEGIEGGTVSAEDVEALFRICDILLGREAAPQLRIDIRGKSPLRSLNDLQRLIEARKGKR